MVAHSMELDELLFSSFFMDHGNNNEAKSLSSNINDKIFYLGARKTKTWTLRAPSFLMIGASDTTAALLYITGNGFTVLSKLPDSDISPLISVSNYHVTITNPQDWGINVIICYLGGMACKATTKVKDEVIPVVCGVTGGILGVAGMYLMPEFPATDVINAAAIGIVSGLAATGAHQVIKQASKK